MNPVKRVLLVLAATAMLLMAFTALAGAQTAYPPTNVAGAGASAGGGTGGTTGGTTLPFTGSSHTFEYTMIGAGAALVGGVLVVLTRRRRDVSPV